MMRRRRRRRRRRRSESYRNPCVNMISNRSVRLIEIQR
jgi:hypothetical protein